MDNGKPKIIRENQRMTMETSIEQWKNGIRQ